MSTAPLANPANDIRPDGFFSRNMAQSDPAIAAAISKELEREKYQVELIASENNVSKAVMEAQGSVPPKIGRGSRRETGGRDVENRVVAGSLINKQNK